MTGSERILKQIERSLINELERSGILCRVFSRVKSKDSLDKKLEREGGKYQVGGKLIQDSLGFRVAVYFHDDCAIVEDILKSIFDFDAASSSIDMPDLSTFSALRRNLVFRLPADVRDEFLAVYDGVPVDASFEIQLRSILSEGWHEVEHDLRYKCKSDWAGHDDLSRTLNGIYASIETSDWGMLTLFDELAYRYYKSGMWSQMVRAKFRLRLTQPVSDDLALFLTPRRAFAKKIFRLNRVEVIKKIFASGLNIPLVGDNLIYVCNYWFIGDKEVEEITPSPLLALLNE